MSCQMGIFAQNLTNVGSWFDKNLFKETLTWKVWVPLEYFCYGAIRGAELRCLFGALKTKLPLLAPEV